LVNPVQVCKAIEFEVERQISVLEAGGVVENETRNFDVDAKATVPMRDKESKQDYRGAIHQFSRIILNLDS
jgi:aspartyl-tRNA(Asn)/glutamyl-tRNA(Gln) amidotransferase subunit B